MNTQTTRHAASADIALLLEGTFPYVRGGVSSWVDQMIRSFPEKTFAIVFIGSREEDYQGALYTLPENVVHFETHYLYRFDPPPLAEPALGDPEAFERSAALHQSLRSAVTRPDDIAGLMADVIPMIQPGGRLGEDQFLYSKTAWEYITEQYHERCTDPSFTDYFWTVRIMHKPLWQLARIADKLPPAKVYHTVSTGYAGFLGALLHYKTGRALLVSEHGIYTKERKIDLLQSSWIRDNRGIFEKDISEVSYFRELWVSFFEALGRVCYSASSEMVSLFEGNRLRQIADGAPAAKTRNVPNGIDIARFAALRARRGPGVPQVIVLIGRVVSIKDVKTFIRSIFTVSRQFPDVEGWIAGPETEDPAYAQECRSLVQSLDLARNVKFLGFQRVDDLLPKVGIVALSSISEGLPLVVLEAFAAGVPVVSTDVGSCRQLVEGLGAEDQALGKAGAIVPIANSQALATALNELLHDEARWYEAQRAAIARVEAYYTQDKMIDAYRGIYDRLAQLPDAQPVGGGANPTKTCPVDHRSMAAAGQGGHAGQRVTAPIASASPAASPAISTVASAPAAGGAANAPATSISKQGI
ncbi:GT4 family glycosyltransferase PelF [Pararobbsia alpina]|uniref:D-inositol-3-phosphate glycosyltransferase n=1 Tax=Pararobbsia alpina TaxID=621374 RepID=A0A6S7BNL0_9BURK|nr:GT4 family glycosyltransferase PelF [Pararobbsia alpina]CAB3791028.1 D-inositol-3-phosphate glycosyltransferase [Pararobbsia alpina]